MTSTADVVCLVLYDEAIHGCYSGYIFQRGVETYDTIAQRQTRAFVFELLDELYQLELRYPEVLYQPFGLHGGVANLIRYNVNKVLMNLGYPWRFDHDEITFELEILAASTLGSGGNHDFLPGSDSVCTIGKAEDTVDED